MAKHRKSQRMFSREQRAANRAEVGKISAADRQRIQRIADELTPDIWHDDDGIWRQIDGQTYGSFASESDAEAFSPRAER